MIMYQLCRFTEIVTILFCVLWQRYIYTLYDCKFIRKLIELVYVLWLHTKIQMHMEEF